MFLAIWLQLLLLLSGKRKEAKSLFSNSFFTLQTFASLSASLIYICRPMKKTVLVSLVLLLFALAFAQEMHVKKPNFTSFNTDPKNYTKVLHKNSSSESKLHPEYGILPFNAQCTECVELIDKRTVDSRIFLNPNKEGHTYNQQSFFPLHYRKSENDIWRTIDWRLRPDANKPGVYAAANQPVPAVCDLNTKTVSLTDRGFEFVFNKDLSLYFTDENTVYTAPEKGNYTTYTVGQEGLHVKNIWNGIDMEQFFRMGEVKTSFVINSRLQLPVSKGFMVIEDHFTLPEGYTFEEAKNGEHINGKYFGGDYLVKDAQGETRIIYERPSFHDALAWGVKGNYILERTGNDYTLKILVPVEWLNNPDNVYPIVIDPIVVGKTKIGDFTTTGNPVANFGFTTKPASCDYQMVVQVPGRSTLLRAFVDLEYRLQFDPMCGNPPLPSPFCTFSQVTQEIICNNCATTTGNLVCNPAAPPYTGTCTTDSNLVPNARAVLINNFVPNYLSCMPPQCPDFLINFTLKNRDSTCGDVCGYLCANGYMWQMTVEACRVEGYITQDKTQVCAGQPVVFTAHPSCGVPPYHYAWTQNGGNSYDTIYGTPNYTIYPNQDVFVNCIIIDNCGEIAVTNDLGVTVIPTPPADAGADIHLCAGGVINIGGSPTTTGGATVQWTGENGTGWLNSTNVQNPLLSVPNGTIDTFFYAVRASNISCFRTDTVIVYSSPAPMANAGGDVTLCAGGVVTLGGNPSSNAANVQWTGETTTITGWLNNTTDFNPQANIPTGTVDTFYYVLNATTATCFKTDTVVIFSNPSPIANAGSDFHLCEGGTITIGGNPTATSSASVLWSGDNATSESWLSSTSAFNPQVTVPLGTVGNFFYVARAFDPLCFKTDTMNVFSHANPVAIADTSGSTRICTNQSVTIFVSGNFASYQWSNGRTGSAITVNQSGQYYAVVTDQFGCKDTSNIITVTSFGVPSVNVFPDTLIMFGDSVALYTDINLSSASVDSFMWYPALNISCPTCNNPVVTPLDAAQYYGVNVYANGCLATDSALIRVIFPNNFFIPNAFTPNGDGNNDVFFIQKQGGVEVLLFQVFNRWGEKVHDALYPWDGRYKEKPATPGVYVYVFKLKLFGEEHTVFRKGSISLIR